MAFYRRAGSVPPKRHTQHRAPAGELYFEELVGENGFSSDSSLLYHVDVPAALVDARPWELPNQRTVPNQPLLPRHLRLHDLFPDTAPPTDAVTGRRLVLGNSEVRISYVVARDSSSLYRDAVGDECVYVESGAGVLETAFGALDVATGDYVVIPCGTAHRWVVPPGLALRLYCIEAASHIAPPPRYLSSAGQFLEHAPYCERDLRAPSDPVVVDEDDVEVFVKHRSATGVPVGSVHTYARHPFDLVGWDGCLYPYAFNISDFEPITGRIHQPPPSHQVFGGDGFVICNFVPRQVDYHPLAVPVPYYHSNVDSDEVLFYCGGDYEARKGSGIAQGSLSLHPAGHVHGPQPGAQERSLGVRFFDELAVMVDTFRPVELGEVTAVEDPAYAWSWSRPRARG
jgi:homogentisate 1,2-dioxygenase